jgi:precorrin-8X/cobalt-precorrin-8 methylmutase
LRKIVIVAHGSPKKSANNLEDFAKAFAVSLKMNPQDIKPAYLQFSSPSLESALLECIQENAKEIIVHPFFLSSGTHVTSDIPEILEKFRKNYPQVEIIYTKPLGLHEKLFEILKERIEEVRALKAEEIEEKSMEIIEKELNLINLPLEQKLIIRRVIHATADFEYKDSMVFYLSSVSTGLKALKEGKDILVDVEMVKAGISEKYLGSSKIICYLDKIEDYEITKTAKAIETALKEEKNIGIVAIGNSPTALLKAIEIFNEMGIKDKLLIGMPVGFVKALSAKLLLSKQDFPFITNLSRKGGSPATAAVINALLRMKGEKWD